MSGNDTPYSLSNKKRYDTRFLVARLTNNTSDSISAEVAFKKCKSDGVISEKSYILIENIEPGETMEEEYDLFWMLGDWTYVEVTHIEVSGTISGRKIKTIPVNYRIDKGTCFVATACFGESNDTVAILRSWRDNSLRNTIIGRVLIYFYGKFGPLCAIIVASNPILRRYTARILKWLAARVY